MSSPEAPDEEVKWDVAVDSPKPLSQNDDEQGDKSPADLDLGGTFETPEGDTFNFADDTGDAQFGDFAWNQDDEELKQDIGNVPSIGGSLHDAFAEFSFLDEMVGRQEDNSLDELAELQAKLASLKSREGKLHKHMRHQSRIIDDVVPEDAEADFGAGDEVIAPDLRNGARSGHQRRRSLLSSPEDIEKAGKDFEEDVSEIMMERELKMWLRKEDVNHPAARAIQTLKDKFEELHGRFMKLSNKYIAMERKKKDLETEVGSLRELKQKYGKMVVENEVENELNKQKAMLTRKQWKVGSTLEVYSFSTEEWYKGTIVKVDFEPEENVELLEVEYVDGNGKRKRKHVERDDMETVREWYGAVEDKQKEVHDRVQQMMKSENQRLKERLEKQRQAGAQEREALREQRSKLQKMMTAGSEEGRELKRLLEDMDKSNETLRDKNESLTIQNQKLLKSVKTSEKKAEEMATLNEKMKEKMQQGGESKQMKARLKAYKLEAEEAEEEAQHLRMANVEMQEKYDDLADKFERLEDEHERSKSVQNSNLEKKKSHLRQLSQTAGKMASDQQKKKYEQKIKQLEMQVAHWETAFHQKPTGPDPAMLEQQQQHMKAQLDEQLNAVIDSKFRLVRNTSLEIEKMRDDLRKMSGGASIGALQRYSRPGSAYRQRANTYNHPGGGRAPGRQSSMLDRYMNQVRAANRDQPNMNAASVGVPSMMGVQGVPGAPMTHLQENKTQVINYYMGAPQQQQPPGGFLQNFGLT